jgi:hypothetical protein
LPNQAIQIEGAVRDTALLIQSMSAAEKSLYRKSKRALLRSFSSPNAAVKQLVDVASLEYILYMRKALEGNGSVHAKNIREFLCELDLTPKSKKTTEVATTLSQVLSHLGGN